MEKYLLIIAGWHFSRKLKFYQTIKKACNNNSNVNIFISSHKKIDEINPEVLNNINELKNCQLVCFENKGFDWGMFSQAIDYLGNRILKYDYIFFMHDDIIIRDFNFISIFTNFIEENNLVMAGNSSQQVVKKMEFPKISRTIIKWGIESKWNIQIKSKAWTTVRGSFFVAKKCVFEKVKFIPFKNENFIKSGSYGVVLFSGLVSDAFGTDSIDTISDKFLKSPYILECYRGKKFNKLVWKLQTLRKNIKKKIYKFIFNSYIQFYNKIVKTIWICHIRKIYYKFLFIFKKLSK